MIKIAPSILSSDFSMLGQQVADMEKFGADLIHIDVMDGHFVPNLTIGPCVVKSIRSYTSLPFDVHLMLTNPLDYIDAFADAGADIISFHVESSSPIDETIERIIKKGIKPGLVVKPATDIEAVFPYLKQIGMVLVMTVEPGFGGQSFMHDMLDKIKALKREVKKKKLNIDIEVDGGITINTVSLAAQAGANWFVAGNAIFKAQSPAIMIAEMKNAAKSILEK